MLFLLRAIVTLTPASRKANSSGEGRKSRITFRLPKGSSVYLILALINCLAFPPIACTENADHSASMREPHAKDSAADPSEAVIASFLVAVRHILSDYPARVGESVLGLKKGDPMFLLVFEVLS
jgi:hypothetical protein